jgi:hypothetical protein
VEAPTYWAQGKPRWFVSGELMAGPVMMATTMAGYGKPHWMWVGFEGFAASSLEFGGGYASLKATLAVVTLQLGVREFFSYEKSDLPVQKAYTKAELYADPDAIRAQHWSFEAKLGGVLPLSPFYAFLELAYSKMLDPPDQGFVFDELQRAVIDSPHTFAARLGTALAFFKRDRLLVGVINEYVYLPGRWREHLYRIGPVGSFDWTDHVQLLVFLTFPVVGPDDLGALQGVYGNIGVVYRWASGEPRPGL